jgi:hypothetical protein
MKIHFPFILCSLIGLLAACQSVTEMPTTPPTLMPTVSSSSLPTVAMDCPVATEGTLLLRDDDNSFCLSYPAGYGVITPPVAGEVCLVPGEPPYMECNGAGLVINVEEAEGRTVDQVADTVTVDMNCSDVRYNLTIANEQAVVSSECKGQDLSRKVFIIHENHLYTLTFIDLSERFYAQVITSFGFLR